MYEEFVKCSQLKIQMILKRLLSVNKAALQTVERHICVYNPVLNHTEANALNTIEDKKKCKTNKNTNTGGRKKKSIHIHNNKKGFSFLSLSQEAVNARRTKPSFYNKYHTSSTNISSVNNTSTNDIPLKHKVGFSNKQISKILSLNDISSNKALNKHAFEERMLIRAKRGLRLSQKHLISQIDNASSSIMSPGETNANSETASPFLTTVHSKSNLPKKHASTKKTFSVSIERKSNSTSMNSTLKHAQAFRTPMTKAKIKKYSVFDSGLDYFDFEGDYKHFRHKKKQLTHYGSPNYNDKTFKSPNTLSLNHIDGDINRKNYNAKLKRMNMITSLKQAKHITYSDQSLQRLTSQA